MKKTSVESCHNYWSEIVNDICSLNQPIFYANKNKTILNFLIQYWSSYVSKTHNILELGCNCGVNLDYLYNNGYKNLSGIEINRFAIDEMKRLYPTLYNNITILNYPIEDIITTIPNKSYDTVFTMAVLMHIHPSSIKKVFTEIERITSKYVITLENENSVISDITFIRNYKKEFKKIGLTEIKSIILTNCIIPNIDTEYNGYTLRIFEVK